MDESNLGDDKMILTNDVKGTIRPALAQLKVAVMRRTQGFRQVSTAVAACMKARLDRKFRRGTIGGLFFL